MKTKLIIVFLCFVAVCTASAYSECDYFDVYGDHDWINGKTEASCEISGETFRDCSVCGLHEVIATINATKHNWIESAAAADCTTSGEKYRDCSICGKHEVLETYDALGHSWTDIVIESTCETAGETVRECSRCGLRETIDSTPALGHDWVQGKTEATCETKGEVFKECNRCGNHLTIEVIKELSHNWIDKELISKADCENDGSMRKYCTICGEERVFILPSSGHSYGNWEILDEATCTHEGLQSRVCYTCGSTITEDIPRTAHDYGDWTVLIEATDSSMGKRSHKCNDCGASAEEWYYPEGTLYRGMHKNDEVLELQQNLMLLGYLKDKADGIFGKKTEQAVLEYQNAVGFEPSGIAYPQTLASLTDDIENISVISAENINDCCQVLITGENKIEIVYCTKHNELVSEETDLFSDSDTFNSLRDIRDIWQAELEVLHEKLLEIHADTESKIIEDSYKKFCEYLSASVELWNYAYADEPEKAIIYEIDMLKVYCATLCSMVK